jgi:hypothetical protein
VYNPFVSSRLPRLAVFALAACSTPPPIVTPPPDPNASPVAAVGYTPADSMPPELAVFAMAEPSTTPDAGPVDPACRGEDIDLLTILRKDLCDVPSPAKRASPRSVAVTVTPKSSKVRPGARVELDVRFLNLTARDLELHFQRAMLNQYDNGFWIGVRDAADNRFEQPTGERSCTADPIRPAWSRVVLAAGGSARAPIAWQASRYAWAPKVAANTIQFNGCPVTQSAPLAPGKYQLTLMAPLEIARPGGSRPTMSVTTIPIEIAR